MTLRIIGQTLIDNGEAHDTHGFEIDPGAPYTVEWHQGRRLVYRAGYKRPVLPPVLRRPGDLPPIGASGTSDPHTHGEEHESAAMRGVREEQQKQVMP